MDAELLRQRVGPVVAGLGVGIPALIVSGFLPEIDVVPVVGWAAVAAVSGAVSGALMAEHGKGLASALGFVGAPLCLVAISVYTALRASLSSTYFSIEFLIPMAVVLVPLMWVHRRIHPPELP